MSYVSRISIEETRALLLAGADALVGARARDYLLNGIEQLVPAERDRARAGIMAMSDVEAAEAAQKSWLEGVRMMSDDEVMHERDEFYESIAALLPVVQRLYGDHQRAVVRADLATRAPAGARSVPNRRRA